MTFGYQIVTLHSAMFFKVGDPHRHHKRDHDSPEPLKADTWHFLDTDGNITEMPEALAAALETEQ